MFIGRKTELKQLAQIVSKPIASLVIIKGRRRIGKSRLVNELANRHPKYKYYKFVGLPPSQLSETNQMEEFSHQFARNFQKVGIYFKEWGDAFYHLSEACKNQNVILLFDEISWMGTNDKNFAGKLKTAWDLYFKENPNLTLILCGSVSSWIEDNIINNTGFVGRISHQFQLNELPLPDCNEFWQTAKERTSPYEKLKLLAVTGGIPRYLEELNPNLTSEQNINNLCYRSDGLLFHEFHQIFYTSLGRETKIYEKIISLLSEKPFERSTLCKKLHIPNNSQTTRYINNLISAGFIKRSNSWDIYHQRKTALSQLRIKDNYILFYLKSIRPFSDTIKDATPDTPFDIKQNIHWHAILGYQFENLVLNNYHKLWELLGININEIVFHNPYFQRKTISQPGCQIDYLIQTKFNNLYICEIKFSKNEIGTEIISAMEQKIAALKKPKGFSLRPVLIHVNGVSETVESSGYFNKIIDFGQLLEH